MTRLAIMTVLWLFDVLIYLTIEDKSWEELRVESRAACRRYAQRRAVR